MTRFIKLAILVFILNISITDTRADSWLNPSTQTYYSENKEYMLIVTPTIIPDKYYKWKHYRSISDVEKKKITRKKQKFLQTLTSKDTVVLTCVAVLYKITNSDTIKVWERPLLNEVCPVNVIVSNDGSSISTFDNWYTKGYGLNVFVVYNDKGNAEATYKLEEISPFPLNDYFTSISSLHWYKGSTYLDRRKIEITFRTQNNITKSRVYDLETMTFKE